jgi:hypothetical protein
MATCLWRISSIRDDLADLYVQKYDANGKISSDRVRVNPTAGEVKAWKGDPPTIAVGQDRTVYVG